MVIVGHYLDGITSTRSPARMELNKTDNRVVDIHIQHADSPDTCLRVACHDLKVESRLGDIPRELMFGIDELFVTDDHEAVDELVLSLGSSSVSLLHRLESHLTLIIVAAVVTVLVSWGSITYGIPALAKQIAYQLPVFVSGELGSGLDVLDKTLFSPSELPQSRKDEVKSVLELFLVDHKNLQPTLHFRSGMKANAFALPNGDIVFTDDLVELVKEDEELVAVLFHELGHLQYKHITRRALQNSMVALLTIFIMGDVDVPIDLLAVPTVILDLSYSRAFESEADLYALDELNKSGIDLDNFANVMVRLNKYYNDGKGDHFARPINDTPSFLQTHPTTEDRVSLVQQYKASHNLD